MGAIYNIVILTVTLIIGITIHEFSHAWVAYKLGDPTAKFQGRVSLNPLKHLDPIGLIMIFIAHIGWGKPVPVNPRNFTIPKRDNAIVSLAGPMSNMLMAMIMTLPYKLSLGLISPFGQFINYFLGMLIWINIILFAFNLIPFKPLDGSAILGFFIPNRYYLKYENFMTKHTAHFMLFILLDVFIINDIFGTSIIQILIFHPAQLFFHLIIM